MNQAWFRIVVSIAAVVIALFCGITIGNGDYVWVLVASATVLLFALLFVLWPQYLPEAKIMAFLLVGNLIFQRLFADLRVSIIFINEAALALTGFLFMMRFAFQRSRLLPFHAITYPIAAFLLLGIVRFVLFDYKSFGLVNSARDFAVVYYMAFYFIGYAIGVHGPSREMVIKYVYRASAVYLAVIIPAVLILLPLGIFAFYITVLSTRDLAVIIPAYATLLLGVMAIKYRRHIWYGVALVMLTWVVYLRARAGYVAFGAGAVIFLAATSRDRQTFFLRGALLTATTVVLAAIILITSELAQVKTIQPFVAEVSSIFDPGAFKERKRAVTGSAGEYSAETTRWRTAWWQAVYDETMDKNPVFGLGFGYDLAKRFNREYYGRSGGATWARNPHNVAFTFLGRLGLAGLALFIFLCAVCARETIKVIRAIRAKQQPLENINLWIVIWSVIMVGLFSHTFEGPMAAVPFWTLLGIAVAQQVVARRVAAEKPVTPTPPPPFASHRFGPMRERVPA